MSMFLCISWHCQEVRAPIDNSTDDGSDACMADGTETGLEALRGKEEGQNIFAPM